jgi:hypothetical protein
MVYLSSRAIGQSHYTKAYLQNIAQGSKRLPDGPVLLSPTSVLMAFRKLVGRCLYFSTRLYMIHAFKGGDRKETRGVQNRLPERFEGPLPSEAAILLRLREQTDGWLIGVCLAVG